MLRSAQPETPENGNSFRGNRGNSNMAQERKRAADAAPVRCAMQGCTRNVPHECAHVACPQRRQLTADVSGSAYTNLTHDRYKKRKTHGAP